MTLKLKPDVLKQIRFYQQAQQDGDNAGYATPLQSPNPKETAGYQPFAVPAGLNPIQGQQLSTMYGLMNGLQQEATDYRYANRDRNPQLLKAHASKKTIAGQRAEGKSAAKSPASFVTVNVGVWYHGGPHMKTMASVSSTLAISKR